MSKNTASSAFRKIDVDQYNEDNYKEDEGGDPQSPPIGPDENEITNLLNQYPFQANYKLVSFKIHSYILGV
jgi:actin related protein 2/3 complex subunit 5